MTTRVRNEAVVPMVVELNAYNYRLRLAPQYGATLLEAEWHHPDGSWVELLEPLATPEAGLKAGCFVMAPFANRIDCGRFAFEGKTVQLPINAPQEGMAIHGFSRMHSWEVVETSDNRVHVRDEVHSDDHPYSYRLDQIIDIAPDGFRISLSIQNEGDSALPFGIGLHPWFSKTNKATLEFQSNGAPQLDTRGLPQGIPEAIDWFTPGNTIALSKLSLVNCCFTGWNREATIRWPETSTGLRLKGEGALRHLHVFNPQDRAVFCAEPVSHLPDVINRPALGEDAAMTVLNPGEALTGALLFSAHLLPDNAPGICRNLRSSNTGKALK